MKHILAIALLALALAILVQFYPVGVDWRGTFSRVSIATPYTTPSFIGVPWTTLLLPHKFLPLAWGNAINLVLNVGVILLAIKRLGGNWKTILLVFTSPVFFDLARTNNVEWIPLLGLLAGPALGSALLLCKPQCLAGAMLIWFKRDRRVLWVVGLVIALSFLAWGWWPARIVLGMNKPYNFSVFPIGVPYGIYLLWQAWREDDVYLAAVATPLLVPYIAPYSLVGVLAVLASRRPKAGYWLYFGIWAYTIIEFRRLFLC